MKPITEKLFVLGIIVAVFLALVVVSGRSQGMRISAYPNTNSLPSNALFIVAVVGLPGTNYNISAGQLLSFIGEHLTNVNLIDINTVINVSGFTNFSQLSTSLSNFLSGQFTNAATNVVFKFIYLIDTNASPEGITGVAMRSRLPAILWILTTNAGTTVRSTYALWVDESDGQLKLSTTSTNAMVFGTNGAVTIPVLTIGVARNVGLTATYSPAGHIFLDANSANVFYLDATANLTLHFTNAYTGWNGYFMVKQDGTGNRTITLDTAGGSNIKTNATITLSTAANALDRIDFSTDATGTNTLITLQTGFQ